MKTVLLGVLASFFFAITFVLNRAMNLSGGSWIWSAVLRYFFMVPPLLLIVTVRGNLTPLLMDLRTRPKIWLGWSTVGFGLFYAPLCFASAFGPAWLVASTWQITIVAGSLLVPLFFKKTSPRKDIENVSSHIPVRSMIFSSLILAGVAFIEVQQARNLNAKELLYGIIPVIIASFAYPLGNRKMMLACSQKFDAYQRVLGMTLSSMPFWFILAALGIIKVGMPNTNQILQTIIVAISSGVIATLLFFSATDKALGNLHILAAVEATQSGEVIFALIGELVFLKGQLPSSLSIAGIFLVILGMVLHSFWGKLSKE